jgi:hypothetical protein
MKGNKHRRQSRHCNWSEDKNIHIEYSDRSTNSSKGAKLKKTSHCNSNLNKDSLDPKLLTVIFLRIPFITIMHEISEINGDRLLQSSALMAAGANLPG